MIVPMSRSDVSRLRRLSTPRYWKQRQQHSERSQRWTRRVIRWRGRIDEARDGVRAAWNLVTASLGLMLVAVAGIALLELTASLLQLIPLLANSPLLHQPPTDLSEVVTELLGTAIAVGATLLGLYYATVGIVASTIYKSVPGDVRDLFIRERTNETYLKILIFTVSGGLASLVAGALGHHVSGVTLLAIGGLAALTCVGLVVITKRLLDFFDPSKLAIPLARQLVQAVDLASAPKMRENPHRQAEAHRAAYRAIASYRHLVDMLSDKEFRNAKAPVLLSRQLLELLKYYSSWKFAVPTDSNWWNRVPRHQNWLTPDHSKLTLAINSSAGFPPELQPDYLWLEKSITQLLSKCLDVAFRSRGGADALAISEAIAEAVAQLTARLQIDEALIIEGMWDTVVLAVTTTPSVASADADAHELRMNQMAAAESLVRPKTMMLLGLSRAAESLSARDLPTEFENALRDPNNLYRGSLPTETRQMLEQFATAIRRETFSEGRRVTPTWWVSHFAARSMAEALLSAEAGVVNQIHERIFDKIVQFEDSDRPDLAAVAGMSSLELLHKIDFHEPIIRAAEEKLASYKNQNTSNNRWPIRIASEFDPADEHRSLLKKLAELLPELRKDKFDPREPDLYGQLYQFVVDGAFKAILDGDKERGLAMYGAAQLEMDHARLRVMADLEKHEDETRLLYALEPVITAMDLAGYALLMHELDGDGIWTQMKSNWDKLVTAVPEVPSFLLTAALFVDGTFAMTVGGLERSRRSIELGQVFESRNIGKEDWSYPRRGAAIKQPHSSPIVSAFAPRGYGIQDDLYALFIAEYLVPHLPPDADIGRKAEMVADQIARYRERSSQPDQESERGGKGE